MATETQLALSLTEQALSGIYPVHSLPQVAKKKQYGRRKHLDLLVEDIHRRNTEVDPFDSLGIITQHKEKMELAQKSVTDTTRKGYWDPPYVSGGAPGKVMARSVNMRRTVDGSFFEAINPALFQQHQPSTQPPKGPYLKTLTALHRPRTAPQGTDLGTSAAASEFAATTEEAAASRPATALPPVKAASQTLTGGSMKKSMGATWLTPAQTGDRAEGARVAKMVKHRRQASGAFFEDRPAQIKIGG